MLKRTMQPISLAKALDETHQKYWGGTSSDLVNASNCKSLLLAFGDVPIGAIDSNRIDTVIRQWQRQGKAPATIKRHLSILSKAFKNAYRLGWIDRPPVIEAPKVPPNNRIRCLSKQEEMTILDCLFKRDLKAYQFCIVALDTGLRVSEVLGLTPANIQGNHVTVYETKNGKPRSIPLTNRAKLILSEGGSDPFFKGLQYSRLKYLWNLMKYELGYQHDTDLVIHTLRHTFISRLVQNGVHLLTVQQLAGHSSPNMTARYTHFASHHLESAIATLEEPVCSV